MGEEPGQGLTLPSVILSAAKDLRPVQREILRCAQDDSSAEVNAYGASPCPYHMRVIPVPDF